MWNFRFIWQGDRYLRLVFILATAASIASAIHFSRHNLTTAYGDSLARLMISRQVIDSPNPGLSHLGGIWPPEPQVAMLPFIWHDGLYQSGLAGAIPQMLSYVVAAVFLYKLIVRYTKNRLSGLAGAIAFSCPSMLFMQAVPMSESMFITYLTMSVYFLARWTENTDGNIGSLFGAGFATLASAACRYEGWILLFLLGIFVLFVMLTRPHEHAQTKASLVVFGFWPVGGTLLWFLYNYRYYGDPLYFLRSQYAPWAIVKSALAAMDPDYVTKGDLWLSTKVYLQTTIDMAGLFITILAISGLMCFLIRKQPWPRKLVGMTLLFPLPFFVASLYGGSSVVIWHPDFTDGANWGTRYGTLMLPAVGFFVGQLVLRYRWWTPVLLTAVVVATGNSWTHDVLPAGEAIDNRDNPEARAQTAAGRWLHEHYDKGMVLIQRFENERTVFASSIALKKVVYEGSEYRWDEALRLPTDDIRWVFMRQQSDGRQDQVMRLKGNPDFQADFEQVYAENGREVYRRRHLIAERPLARPETVAIPATTNQSSWVQVVIPALVAPPTATTPIPAVSSTPAAPKAAEPKQPPTRQPAVRTQTPVPVTPLRVIQNPPPPIPVTQLPVVRNQPPTATVRSQPTPATSYVVQPGDNIARIAEKVYGSQRYWLVIYVANQRVLGDNPDRVLPGTVLTVPR